MNQSKTKLLIVGRKPDGFSCGSRYAFGKERFECVDRFKYLGVLFDSSASSKTMILDICEKGR